MRNFKDEARARSIQSIISSQNVFDVSEGKHVTSTIFSPLSFIAILDVPRNPLSLSSSFFAIRSYGFSTRDWSKVAKLSSLFLDTINC